MIRFLLLTSFLLQTWVSFSQKVAVQGIVMDSVTKSPIEGVSILVNGLDAGVTDEHGLFALRMEQNQRFTTLITGVGYESKEIDLIQTSERLMIYLQPASLQLEEVRIQAGPSRLYAPISQVDIKIKGVDNTQEVLRIVPGLFIGQHAGGGKAEQIFLRGFDVDHGTDIAISVDGMPVNMVSHAHGQGYADLHFVIPELVEKVAYDASKGNFSTAGSVDLKTFQTLEHSSVKVEAGMFNTLRSVGLFDLLGKKGISRQQSAYVASEYHYSDGFFDHPQDFNRLNLFGKYTKQIARNAELTFTASTFSSKWKASGQIPERAVDKGSISYFGAIDPNEGGKTGRSNANIQFVSSFRNGAVWKNQAFYSRYDFTLFSNFTFYKVDHINGDQIKQKEVRDVYGYRSSYSQRTYLHNVQLTSDVGLDVRVDKTNNTELSRTVDRSTILERLSLGNITESNIGIYLKETFRFSQKFTFNFGLRYDRFFNGYTDHLNVNSSKTAAGVLSPKGGLFYHPNKKSQLYFTAGKGFHSNDTRVVVQHNGPATLPPTVGADLGWIFKPTSRLLIHSALWALWMQQEFVYVGDEAVVEPSGKTKRTGVDLSARYQTLDWLYFDLDLNLAKPRAIDEPKGNNYLPLAPLFTSVGGVTIQMPNGLSGSLRARYLGNRPANEDNSTIAKGYFVTDLVLNHSFGKWETGIKVFNLFNAKWKETQFETESQLKYESSPVSEIHFTPGTPFSLRVGITYHLK